MKIFFIKAPDGSRFHYECTTAGIEFITEGLLWSLTFIPLKPAAFLYGIVLRRCDHTWNDVTPAHAITIGFSLWGNEASKAKHAKGLVREWSFRVILIRFQHCYRITIEFTSPILSCKEVLCPSDFVFPLCDCMAIIRFVQKQTFLKDD